MLEYLEPIMIEKGPNLNKEERELVNIALINHVKPLQKLWKTLITLEKFPKFVDYDPYIKEMKDNTCEKLDEECQRLIDLIQRHFIDPINIDTPIENQAYFVKLKADYWRYIEEVASGDRQEKAASET